MKKIAAVINRGKKMMLFKVVYVYVYAKFGSLVIAR